MHQLKELLMWSFTIAFAMALCMACQTGEGGAAGSKPSASGAEMSDRGPTYESSRQVHSPAGRHEARRLLDGQSSPERDELVRDAPRPRPRDQFEISRDGRINSHVSRHPGLLFENPGIYDERAAYVLKKEKVSVFFTPTGFRLSAPTGEHSAWTLVLEFVDGEASSIEGEGLLPSKVNSFVGDASTWRSNLSAYRKLVYRDVWAGIDVVYEPRATGLEYSLIVHPGADVSLAQFRYEGVDGVHVSAAGELLLATEFGEVSETRPIAFQGPAAQHRDVEVGFVALGDGVFGFEVGDYRTNEELVIDPTLLYGSFLGGGNGSAIAGEDEIGYAVALAGNGDVVVAGTTRSDFPTTAGAYDRSHGGNNDVFVSRLSSDGVTLQWSTFLGGGDADYGRALALDSTGNVTVTGDTWSANYPTTAGSYDRSHGGDRDVFVSRLSSDGGTLQWSTFLGGGVEDYGRALALDSTGNVTVTGDTWSTDFPTIAGAYDTSHGGRCDVFVSRLSSDGGTLQWSTFLGGSVEDYGGGLALDSTGGVTVTGDARSTDFPTTPGSYDRTHGGSFDVFISRLSSDGVSLQWSTFVGAGVEDHGNAVALDSAGNVTVTGETYSTDFPTTTGAYDGSHGGWKDAFVFRLSSDGAALQWSTFLGGGDMDYGHALALDSAGNVTVTGQTLSANFPTTAGAYNRSYNGNGDVFVSRLSADGGTLQWSTILGGPL